MTPTAAEIAREAMERIRDYFDQRADADAVGDPTRYQGNAEMHMLRDCDDVERALAAAEADRAEDETLRNRMSDLLTRTAAALKGEPAALTLHDWSDLPRVAAEIKLASDLTHARYEVPQHDAACQHRGQFIDFSGVCHWCRADKAEADRASAVQADIEALAALEHDQWCQWATNVLDTEQGLSSDRAARWRSLMVPYSELSEAMKEHDRKWARKVLATVRPTDSERKERGDA